MSPHGGWSESEAHQRNSTWQFKPVGYAARAANPPYPQAARSPLAAANWLNASSAWLAYITDGPAPM